MHRVEVAPDSDGTVTLRTETLSGQADLVADRVILATPAPVTLGLLSDPDALLGGAVADFLRSTRYTRNLTTAVAYQTPPETKVYGTGVPVALDHSLAAVDWTHMKGPDRVPAGSGLGVLMPTDAYSSAKWTHPDDEVGQELLDATEDLYPGSRKAVLFYRVHRWEHAIPMMQPGQAQALPRALSPGGLSIPMTTYPLRTAHSILSSIAMNRSPRRRFIGS